MRVAELMTSDVRGVRDDEPIAQAVLTMADAHVSGLPVLDRRGRLVGVLSTTDLLEAEAETDTAEAREQLFSDTPVRELMTPKPITIGPDEDARQAAQMMLYGGVHRVFVEQDGELVGVITQSDIVRAVAGRHV
ncbi:MAG: CBS domain-containing protein [Gemmatimonadales bacterium]|nr:CBS domain-containing protein [Gemmatimonadales bacterium]